MITLIKAPLYKQFVKTNQQNKGVLLSKAAKFSPIHDQDDKAASTDDDGPPKKKKIRRKLSSFTESKLDEKEHQNKKLRYIYISIRWRRSYHLSIGLRSLSSSSFCLKLHGKLSQSPLHQQNLNGCLVRKKGRYHALTVENCFQEI